MGDELAVKVRVGDLLNGHLSLEAETRLWDHASKAAREELVALVGEDRASKATETSRTAHPREGFFMVRLWVP